MSEFISTITAELRRLEAELEQDPRYRRIEAIRMVLAVYGAGPDAARPAPSPAPTPSPPSRQLPPRAVTRVVTRYAHMTKAKGVQHALESYLAEKGTAHRRAMLEHLKTLGLMGREKNPMAGLAAYLSAWRNIFATDGKGNFSLRSPAGAGERELPLSH